MRRDSGVVRGALLVALILGRVGLPPAARAGDHAHEPADQGVSVRVERSAEGLAVEGRCVVHAPATVAWAVLTDYDGIDHFVSSMRESRVTERAGSHLLVEQVAVSRLFLFTRRFRATLFVEELPPTTIRFEDVLGKDFDRYQGSWRIDEQPGQLELVYQVVARPHTSVPDALAKGLFRRTARDLLAQVRAEIERRAAAAASSSGPEPEHAEGADVADESR